MGGGRLRVSVVGHDGRPIEGALVTVVEGTAPFPEVSLVTGPDGAVALPFPAGRFVVAAHTTDGRAGRAEVVMDGPDGALDLVVA